MQSDGTSKITIYKPIEAEEVTAATKYITAEELETKLKEINCITIEDLENKIKEIKIPDTKDLQSDIRNLKKQIRILLDKED